MIDYRAMRGPTGRLLRELLVGRGVQIGAPAEAVVSYGIHVSSNLPTLNANAGRRNKLQELQTLEAARVRVPPFQARLGLGAVSLQFPVLGRRLHHVGGTDIVPILARDREWDVKSRRCDFFTQYIPTEREFRVWTFRRNCKGVYEKVLRHPEQFTRVGGNYDNGFRFDFAHNAPEALKQLAGLAVQALELDFGAVDIIQGVDGNFYVLEVNTAPGAEGPRQGIAGVADSIARWVRNGYPRRNT